LAANASPKFLVFQDKRHRRTPALTDSHKAHCRCNFKNASNLNSFILAPTSTCKHYPPLIRSAVSQTLHAAALPRKARRQGSHASTPTPKFANIPFRKSFCIGAFCGKYVVQFITR
jgi:hypothetical protein